MEQVPDLLLSEWQRLVIFLPRFCVALSVLLVSYFAGKAFASLMLRLLRRAALREVQQSFFRLCAVGLVFFFGLVLALNILGLERMAVSLLAGGGVTAVVLGFAFREIGENFIAGLFLAFSRPFRTGDAIRTEDVEGRVQEVELRYTHLRTDDGQDVYVPSSQLFNRPVVNYTRDGLRRISFSVGVDYADDARAAVALLEEAVAGAAGVLETPRPGAFVEALLPGYVELRCFFWVDVFNADRAVHRVRTDALDACRRALLEGGYTVSANTTSNVAIRNDRE